ncbi:MAG TPA: 23S rRNA (pseudouridine(1915)-N(3))-methyltransferase RlmH [Gemmatimonadaceae bacterium]|nr:23S rRNA (pseudouridine(1915)-N(3))-methyltransferase RlmH [Gemmatimonadaceae bacterium]
MRFVVAVVGKPRHAALAAAIDDYETRAARYWPLEVHSVREERAGGLSEALVRKREGERLAEKAGSCTLIACDAAGRSFTSEAFSGWLNAIRERGQDTALLIGGAFGLSEDILQRASMKLSLSPWTLPHELARLVLAEQLYRAGSIVRGEPYHK